MTARATWNGVLLAESDETIIVEGNHYFPPASINRELLADSSTHTMCHWKGQASYYNLVVEGDTNADAVWYYPEPYDAADVIKDYVAFWRGVEVSAEPTDGTPGPNPPGR
jgi:uncharacterized protein (DUF427 family)